MTQFIELTRFGKPIKVNISQIITYEHESVHLSNAGFVAVSDSYPKIESKIAEAQANDPLQRIAVALEKIVNDLPNILAVLTAHIETTPIPKEGETVYYRHKYYSGKHEKWLWAMLETIDDFEPGSVAYVGHYHGKAIYENISDRNKE